MDIIKSNGKISDNCRKEHTRIQIVQLYIVSILTLIFIVTPATVLIAILASSLFFPILLASATVLLGALVPLEALIFAQESCFDVIIIESTEMVGFNFGHKGETYKEINNIDALGSDGFFDVSIKSVYNAKKVIDYGKWYHIIFSRRDEKKNYVCQKDLIVKGTIEDFERLFEGKIVRKYGKEKKRKL
ncbi:MAG: hypothetical protein FWD86_02775 [Firmicutes bacterium]|nr:hypothetical protein [Bacillota bacterium]